MDDTLELSPEFAPGSQFDGFTIDKQIGEGGMARLYLAHEENGRQRVLKVPRRVLDVDPVAVVAFENELRLAHYLEDFPHAYMPVSQHGGERNYLVMDYIEGSDLWAHLRENGCFDEAKAIAMVKKIVRAMAELHRRRIVHLDMKLSNIMVTRDGEIRLIDFGLANHLDLPDHIYESFQEPKGTPAYIAPEQFFGVRDEPRSDIFSIGVMLYEMTTSKLPFPDAQSVLDVINRIKREPVSPRSFRPELSEEFVALVMTCLQNVPDRRFTGMDDLYAALEDIEQKRATSTSAIRTWGAPIATLTSGKLLQRISGRFRRFMGSAENDHVDEIKSWIADHQLRSQAARYRIVAALDNDVGERVEALNRKILSQAIRQAGLQPSIITVLTILKDHNIALATDERERRDLNAAYHEAREHMKRLIAASTKGNLSIGINIRSGDAVEGISGCVRDYDADLMVIGARERSTLSRFVLGNTTYKVLTTIKCPVFVVQETSTKSTRRQLAEPGATGAGVAGLAVQAG